MRKTLVSLKMFLQCLFLQPWFKWNLKKYIFGYLFKVYLNREILKYAKLFYRYVGYQTEVVLYRTKLCLTVKHVCFKLGYEETRLSCS